MLIGIDARMTADLLWALARMGHGDEIVIADANFPAESTARHCDFSRPIVLAGLDAVQAIELVTGLLPIDAFGDFGALRMEIDDAPQQMGEVHSAAWEVLQAVKPEGALLGSLPRREFYPRARRAFAVVQTGEARPYGCFILRKGVVF